jgi:hypothetical protein
MPTLAVGMFPRENRCMATKRGYGTCYTRDETALAASQRQAGRSGERMRAPGTAGSLTHFSHLILQNRYKRHTRQKRTTAPNRIVSIQPMHTNGGCCLAHHRRLPLPGGIGDWRGRVNRTVANRSHLAKSPHIAFVTEAAYSTRGYRIGAIFFRHHPLEVPVNTGIFRRPPFRPKRMSCGVAREVLRCCHEEPSNRQGGTSCLPHAVGASCLNRWRIAGS